MESIRPTISIIIPVYNVEKYIKKCIESVLSQTFKDFELIIINDGSKDNSGRICDEYAIRDSRIKVVHKANGGLSDARNTGIEIATGKYLGFVDGDDYIDEDMYEELYKSIKENNTKIAMCGRYNVSELKCTESFTLSKRKVMDAEEALKGLLTWTDLDSSSCDKIFAKELFDDIRFPVGKLNEDVYVMYKLIHLSGGISHIGKAKYHYVERCGSITSLGFDRRKLDWPLAANEIAEFIKEGYPNLIEEITYFYYCSLMHTIDLIVLSKDSYKYVEIYNEYCNKINKDLKVFLTNKYISRKEKIKSNLIYLNKKLYLKLMKKYYSRKE